MESTIQSLLASAVRRLRAAGSPTPALDAQLWLSHVCGLSRAQLLARPERSISKEEATRFSEGVARLAAGEPLPYLTGQADFYGLTFHLTPATLIPRPETEHLVEAALTFSRGRDDLVIADVGTGCGCIAVTLAIHLPTARLYAIDTDPAALAVAERNAARHHVMENIAFLQGQLLAPLPEKVHLIAANLPYVSDEEWDTLAVGVREFEPAGALRGGKQGLDLIEALLREAPGALHADGIILLEIGAAQGAGALALARSHIPGADVSLQQDYAGRDRLLAIRIR